MKRRNDWEASGSLTPELEGTSRSFLHQKRSSPPKTQSRSTSRGKKGKTERSEISD